MLGSCRLFRQIAHVSVSTFHDHTATAFHFFTLNLPRTTGPRSRPGRGIRGAGGEEKGGAPGPPRTSSRSPRPSRRPLPLPPPPPSSRLRAPSLVLFSLPVRQRHHVPAVLRCALRSPAASSASESSRHLATSTTSVTSTTSAATGPGYCAPSFRAGPRDTCLEDDCVYTTR